MSIAALLDSIPSDKEGIVKDAIRSAFQNREDHQGFFLEFCGWYLDEIMHQHKFDGADQALEYMKDNYFDLHLEMSTSDHDPVDLSNFWMMKITFDLDREIPCLEDELKEYFRNKGFEHEHCHHEYDCCGRYYYGEVDFYVNCWDFSGMAVGQKPKYHYSLVATRKALKNI